MKLTELKAKIINGNLEATCKLNGEDYAIQLNPLDIRVLDKYKTDLIGYTKILIKKEYPLCEF